MSRLDTTQITWHEGAVSRVERQTLLKQKGVTIWMTGLSGSGKSTVASILEQMLLHRGKAAYRLDGDNIRFGLNKSPAELERAGYTTEAARRFGVAFSADDRTENIRRIGEVAKLFTDAGVIAIASFISPYRKDRAAVRANFSAGDFIECYIHADLSTAEKRDPKGLYKKARAGEIKGFTGIDDPYEAPEQPEIRIDTESTPAADAAAKIVLFLEQHGHLQA